MDPEQARERRRVHEVADPHAGVIQHVQVGRVCWELEHLPEHRTPRLHTSQEATRRAEGTRVEDYWPGPRIQVQPEVLDAEQAAIQRILDQTQ